MTDARPARRPRRPWLRRLVAIGAAWLLWKFGDPEGINPAALVGLGAFMYFVGVPVLSVVRIIVVDAVSIDLWVPYLVSEVAEAVWGSRGSGGESAIERLRRWKAEREKESHTRREVVCARLGTSRWKAASLIDHASGEPVASRSYSRGGTARSAMQGVLEAADVEGRVITLDSVDTGFRAVRALVANRADFVFIATEGCLFTLRVAGIDWDKDTVRRYSGRWTLRECETAAERRVRGRRAMRGQLWEHIMIEVCSPGPYQLPSRQVSQAFRATVRTGKTRKGRCRTRILYGVTSLPARRADACELLVLLRNHKTLANLTRESRGVAEQEHRRPSPPGPRLFGTIARPALAMVLS